MEDLCARCLHDERSHDVDGPCCRARKTDGTPCWCRGFIPEPPASSARLTKDEHDSYVRPSRYEQYKSEEDY